MWKMTNSDRSPSPDDVRAARVELQKRLGIKNITSAQDRCAGIVFVTCRAWQGWEKGSSHMHPAFWELFRRKVAEISPQPLKR